MSDIPASTIAKIRSRRAKSSDTPEIAAKTPETPIVAVVGKQKKSKSTKLARVPQTDDEIRALAFYDAELIEKQEKAIKLRRENLLASQSLVDFDLLRNLIVEHYKNSADRINEVLDMLFLKYDLPAAMQKEAWQLILRALNDSLEKTVAGIEQKRGEQ